MYGKRHISIGLPQQVKKGNPARFIANMLLTGPKYVNLFKNIIYMTQALQNNRPVSADM